MVITALSGECGLKGKVIVGRNGEPLNWGSGITRVIADSMVLVG